MRRRQYQRNAHCRQSEHDALLLLFLANLQFVEQLLHILTILGIFIAFSPFAKPFPGFILQLLAEYLVNLQAVAQRLPVTINSQRDRRLLEPVDEFAFALPAAQYPHVEPGEAT